MPWNFTNGQLDSMTLTLAAGGNPVVVACQATIQIVSEITVIAYHGLNYNLVGSWRFPADENVTATFEHGQIKVINRTMTVTAIYQWPGP